MLVDLRFYLLLKLIILLHFFIAKLKPTAAIPLPSLSLTTPFLPLLPLLGNILWNRGFCASVSPSIHPPQARPQGPLARPQGLLARP